MILKSAEDSANYRALFQSLTKRFFAVFTITVLMMNLLMNLGI